MTTALSLFAGVGFGAACQRMGIHEIGVENDIDVLATRAAAGLGTFSHDVWDFASASFRLAYELLLAGPPCFGAGTPVLTRRGSLPIEDVREGDEVWTHENRWRHVTATMTREADAIQIGPIVTTPDHPFFTREQRRRWNAETSRHEWDVNGASKWVPAGQSRGSLWASPLAVGDAPPPTLPDARLAGRYVADGWVSRDGTCLSIGDGREEPEGDWVISQSGSRCRRFTQRLGYEADLIADFGSGAHGKTLPPWLLSASKAYREDFLAGYLAGDGTHIPSGHRAVTVSPNLASQLRLLAISLGYTSNIQYVRTPDTTIIEGRVVPQSDYYMVSIVRNDHRYTRDRDSFRWTKQRREPKSIGVRTVYDLTVEEDHSFLAWGYVVHNCQTFSNVGRGHGRRDLEHIIELAHAIGSGLPATRLRERTSGWDPRTALVLLPLYYALRDRPAGIVLEQVPPVLPVWEAYAEVLGHAGYSVVTGVLAAEAYGVPQTRRRAVLLAHRDREVAMPAPTHSRYHVRNPAKMDPGVKPWVSMADAMEWPDGVVGFPRKADGRDEGVEIEGIEYRSRDLRPTDRPSWAVTGKTRSWKRWGFVNRPATTVTGHGIATRHPTGVQRAHLNAIEEGTFELRPPWTVSTARKSTYDNISLSRSYVGEAVNITIEEGAALQTFDPGFPFRGSASKRWQIIGNAVPPLLAAHLIGAVL